MNSLTILHLNANGLRARLVELCTLLDDANPKVDLVLLNETKLNGSNPPHIPGFTTAALRDRQGDRRAGGGVAIYAASNLQLRDVSPDADDIAAVELRINEGEKMVVISYYAPPGLDVNQALIDPLLASYPAALVLGDFNAKHQFFGCTRTDRAGELLFNLVNDQVQLNKPEPFFLSAPSSWKVR